MTTPGGPFAANLDVERTWALRAGLRPRALSADALERASVLGLLCSVLAPEATALWTPAPVDPACRRPALPTPALVSGPFPQDVTASFGDPAAWRAGHRRWAHEHAQAWGTHTEGATFIGSVSEIAACPAAAGAWVLKAPYAAAGRHRVLGSGPNLPRPACESIERLLAGYNELLLEPWMERVADFGCAVHEGSVLLHGLDVDTRGRFSGIRLGAAASLGQDERDALHGLAEQVRTALHSEGYAGPFGFDAYRYRAPSGQLRFRAICEVNPRFTFGHIAHALVPLARAAWGDIRTGFDLRVGATDEAGLGSNALSLVGSADGRRSHAWLVRGPE